jgi:hypothetical protein
MFMNKKITVDLRIIPGFARIICDKLLHESSDLSIRVIFQLDANRRFQNNILATHLSGLDLDGCSLGFKVLEGERQTVSPDGKYGQEPGTWMNDVKGVIVQKNFYV